MAQYYAPGGALSSGAFRLEGEEARHLLRVARARAGDRIELFDGKGRRVLARLEKTEGGVAEGVVLSELPVPGPRRELHLYMALIARQRFEDALEKATELGAARIVPLEAERGEIRLGEAREGAKLERWRDIVLSAAKQCGRARLPEIGAPLPLAEALAEGPGLFASTAAAPTAAEAAAGLQGPLRVAIGPEGGWSPEELRLASELGWKPFSMGPLTLRAETAAMAACALLLL